MPKHRTSLPFQKYLLVKHISSDFVRDMTFPTFQPFLNLILCQKGGVHHFIIVQCYYFHLPFFFSLFARARSITFSCYNLIWEKTQTQNILLNIKQLFKSNLNTAIPSRPMRMLRVLIYLKVWTEAHHNFDHLSILI